MEKVGLEGLGVGSFGRGFWGGFGVFFGSGSGEGKLVAWSLRVYEQSVGLNGFFWVLISSMFTDFNVVKGRKKGLLVGVWVEMEVVGAW